MTDNQPSTIYNRRYAHQFDLHVTAGRSAAKQLSLELDLPVNLAGVIPCDENMLPNTGLHWIVIMEIYDGSRNEKQQVSWIRIFVDEKITKSEIVDVVRQKIKEEQAELELVKAALEQARIAKERRVQNATDDETGRKRLFKSKISIINNEKPV